METTGVNTPLMDLKNEDYIYCNNAFEDYDGKVFS